MISTICPCDFQNLSLWFPKWHFWFPKFVRLISQMTLLISKIFQFDFSNDIFEFQNLPVWFLKWRFWFPKFVRLISQMTLLISKICQFDFPNDIFEFQNLSVWFLNWHFWFLKFCQFDFSNVGGRRALTLCYQNGVYVMAAKDRDGMFRGSCINHSLHRFGACQKFVLMDGTS